jgi:glycerol-3-phosphate acyltransferase PlsX
MNIALDMWGGDFAPEEPVKAVTQFLSGPHDPSVRLLLTGDQQQLQQLLPADIRSSRSVQYVPAPQIIGMHDHPTRVLKEKPDSSLAAGFRLLAAGQADAFISAGNTGAMLVGSVYSIKVIKGVHRPGISSILPKENGGTGVLLDVGMNPDCKPENLNQFAQLGSLYAKYIHGIPTPRVGLLSIGEEESKGSLLTQAAYPLLKANAQIEFIGNLEGRDVLLDLADVIVCEGYTGNIVLKMAESLYGITQRKGISHPYFDRFEFEQYGGTPVLGITKPVIIGHGISSAKAFLSMISVAEKMISTGLMAKIKASFEKG